MRDKDFTFYVRKGKHASVGLGIGSNSSGQRDQYPLSVSEYERLSCYHGSVFVVVQISSVSAY